MKLYKKVLDATLDDVRERIAYLQGDIIGSLYHNEVAILVNADGYDAFIDLLKGEGLVKGDSMPDRFHGCNVIYDDSLPCDMMFGIE